MNRKLINTTLAFVILFGSFSLLNRVSAQANETPDFTITPINYDLSLRPGNSRELSVTVKNDLAVAAMFSLKSSVFSSDGRLSANADGVEVAKWLTYSTGEIVLEPGTTGSLNYSLTIPEGAKAGVYYLANIVTLTQPTEASTGNSSAVIAEVAQRVNLNVLASDAAKPSLSISNLSGPGLLISGAAGYNWQVQNTSPLFTKPVIYLQVVSPSGEITNQQIVNSELSLLGPGEFEGNVLAANSEVFKEPGIYRFEMLVLDSVDGGAPATSKYVGTLYIPIWLALLIIIAAAGVIYAVVYLNNKYRNKERRSHK